MPTEKEDDEVSLLITPEEAQASEPKRRKQSAYDPNKHLTQIDPILMEKLAKIEKTETGHKVKYVDGIPVFNQERSGSPLYGAIAFLFVVIVGFGGIRMYLSELLVPVALSELVFGKEVPVVLPPARFTIDTSILGYEVAVNGVKQSLFNNQFEYPAGSAPVTVTVSRAGYSTFTTQVTPAAGVHTTIKPTLNQEAQATGFLTYETVPEARLTLFQSGTKVAEYNTPISGQKVPVGAYQAVLENSFIGFRREQTITIEEWKTTSFRLQLDNQGTGVDQPSLPTGSLPSAVPVGAAR